MSAETAFTAHGEPLTGSTDTFGFAGEQHDPTGLQHLRARQYNPGLGRFTTVDPVQPGAPGTTGYNLYAYAGNNPTTFVDPSGRTLTEASVTNSNSARSAPAVNAVGLTLRTRLVFSAFALTGAFGAIDCLLAANGTDFGPVCSAAGSEGDDPAGDPAVSIPTATETVPTPDGADQAEEPEPQLATDGDGSRVGGGNDGPSGGDCVVSLYHGSQNFEGENFDLDLAGANQRQGTLLEGVYLTDDVNRAIQQYAGPGGQVVRTDVSCDFAATLQRIDGVTGQSLEFLAQNAEQVSVLNDGIVGVEGSTNAFIRWAGR